MDDRPQTGLAHALVEARQTAVDRQDEVRAEMSNLRQQIEVLEEELDSLRREVEGLDLAIQRIEPGLVDNHSADQPNRAESKQSSPELTMPVDATTPRSDAVVAALAHLGGKGDLDSVERLVAAHGHNVDRRLIASALSYGKKIENIEFLQRGHYQLTEAGHRYAKQKGLDKDPRN